MAKVYLPTEYLNKPCYVVNNDYIRVYESTNDRDNIVYDVYFKNNYLIRQGSSNFSYSTQCDNINSYTDSIYYRYDFDKIVVIFFIILILCFYFPYRIISRIFGRWLKF